MSDFFEDPRPDFKRQRHDDLFADEPLPTDFGMGADGNLSMSGIVTNMGHETLFDLSSTSMNVDMPLGASQAMFQNNNGNLNGSSGAMKIDMKEQSPPPVSASVGSPQSHPHASTPQHSSSMSPMSSMSPDSSVGAPPLASPGSGADLVPPSMQTPMENTPVAALDKFISDCQQRLADIREEVRKIGWAQSQYLGSGFVNKAESATLSLRHKTLRQAIEQTTTAIFAMQSEALLNPSLIELSFTLLRELYLERRQLDMYEIEVSGNGLPASLVVVQQPFPRCITYRKVIQSPIIIKFISGSCTKDKFKPSGKVTAEVVLEEYAKVGKRRLETVEMKNGDAILGEDYLASFNDLIFRTGTRKKSIQLRFNLELKAADGTTQKIESNLSEPFVVETNAGIQWVDAEGVLLLHETFHSQSEITWYKFCNVLQKRYLKATKQDRMTPIRELSLQDLSWLWNTKFAFRSSTPQPGGALSPPATLSKRTMVTLEQVKEFWKWFGPTVHRIKFQRHLSPLWLQGFICGFVSRHEAMVVLQNASPGTFLLRFSEQVGGSFAITYVSDSSNADQRIRHYLIKGDDLSGAKKSLADFLGREEMFTNIVQIVTHPQHGRVYQQVDKNSALQKYYSRQKEQNTFGYDGSIRR
eukprot:TRINITY_DN6005_c0_g1_i1.p1 TRINITY_DN6005_c0_g1~~TRINITY_DN6005_c0_g1_i1.p1  ORF type:complete len:655 (+),score=138.82 TRINITY_DN6005_c0_g1_i1:48-1967(+)